MRDPLSNYATEARGVFGEYRDLLRHYGLDTVARRQSGLAIRGMSDRDREEALALIRKSPSQRKSLEKRLGGEDEAKRLEAVQQIVRALWLLEGGIRAMLLAESLSVSIPGSGYRDGAARAAAIAAGRELHPDQTDVINGAFW